MRWLLLFCSIAMMAGAQTNEPGAAAEDNPQMIRVTGDRVSLRAAPDMEGYLLDRAMRGDEMIYMGESNGWLAVQAPTNLDFWVAGKYVEDGVVQPEKLNVRAGPNLNYAKVFILNGGDRVEVRDEFNDWLKIAPPAGSCVWISGDYAELIQPPPPEPVIEEHPATKMVEEPVDKPAPMVETKPLAEEPAPVMLVLDKTRRQGITVEIPGILRRATPGLYQLVLVDGGFEEPICLVRGKRAQMERYLNRSMLIKGKRYWVKDVDLPVIQPERIHLDPLINP